MALIFKLSVSKILFSHADHLPLKTYTERIKVGGCGSRKEPQSPLLHGFLLWQSLWHVCGILSSWIRLSLRLFVGKVAFPGGSDGKYTCNVGDPGLILGSGRSTGERNGYPLYILAWKIPWTEGPGGLQSMGSLGRSGEGNGNPLQHSCLENSMDYRGAWWTIVHGIAESDISERLTLSLSFQKRRESFQRDKAGNGVSERRINMCITLEELSRCLTEEGC